MTREMRNELLKAGELIAKGECDCICHAMKVICGNVITWKSTKEARMINPGAIYWWGTETMNVAGSSEEARNARLLGIAMMVTMPGDMIDDDL